MPRSETVEGCVRAIFEYLQEELNYLSNAGMSDQQKYFEKLKEKVVGLELLCFKYFAEINENPTTKLPEIPNKGGYGVN